MKEFETIELKSHDRLGKLTLNRPEKHNAMNALMIAEIREGISTLVKDPKIRLILIKGRGKSFSSGADLNYMKEQSEMGLEENLEDSKKLAKMFYEIFTCPIPVMTYSHGVVAGGANGIIAASDFAVTLENSIFRFSEVNIGLVPATISPYILNRIGRARAMELLMSGRAFSGTEAEKYMLVNKCVRTESDADSLIEEMTNEFMASSPSAVTKTKKILLELSGIDNDSFIDKTARIIAEARASNEGREGLLSFFEKRKPSWLNENI